MVGGLSHAPCFPVFPSCIISSLWVWAGPSDWLLTNRIWQKRWAATSKTRLENDCGLLLPSLALLLALSNGSQPPCHELIHRFSKELREFSGQQPARNHHMLELSRSQMSESGSGFSPSWALRWYWPGQYLVCELKRCPETEDAREPHLDSWSPETVS